MAELVVFGVVVNNLVSQAFSFATEEIGLFLGCKETFQSLARELEIIQALVTDADNKDIQSVPMKKWFKILKDVMFDAEVVLEEYNYELLRRRISQKRWEKVRNFFSPVRHLAFRFEMTSKFKKINSELKSVTKLGKEYGLNDSNLHKILKNPMGRVMTSPYVQKEEIIGRDDDVIKVVEMLVNANNEEKLALTIIVGMGGQGKTTVAQLVFDYNKVVNHFEKILWVCVSDDFNMIRILNEMVQCITHKNPNLTSRQALIEKLQGTLKGKRFLVVFDDIWNEDQQIWDEMEKDLRAIRGSRGTKILVTSRLQNVGLVMRASYTHYLSKLSDNDSWYLFKKIAFANGGAVENPEFVAIGQRILEKCCGVPLAIKLLGGLLYLKRDIGEWLSIEKNDTWSSIDSQRAMMSCIKLSYDHLPSLHVKQCFAYCSIFPKDTLIKRENLIQQWMAHGFLNPSKRVNLQMEDLGSDYFEILLHSSLLQEPRYDEDYGNWTCKMHDLVHDFALQTSDDYCFTRDEKSDVTKIGEALHVSLTHNEMEMIDNMSPGIFSKSRTFYLLGGGEYYNQNMVLRFGCLQSLILGGYEVKELPTSIGRLKLLRYIDIEDTRVERLPDSYIKLYNLQTLRLPEEFCQEILYVGSLVNLRHIYKRVAHGSKSKCNIVGSKQLVNLHTLSHFIVSKNKGCTIDELENLDNLRDRLCIYELNMVMNGDEARKANISRKLMINHLELQWSLYSIDSGNSEEVMEGLIPHSYLKRLTIRYFKGLRIPSWMKTSNNGVLNLLIEVKLEGCDLLEQLPPLGCLPQLKKVFISDLSNVKHIGEEFYGGTSYLRSTSCAFPALEELHIVGMSNLEEWLSIEEIKELTDLPSLQGLLSLKKLIVRTNKKLVLIPSLQGLSSLTVLNIAYNEMLTKLPSLQGLASLTQLRISVNERLTGLPVLQGLSSLTVLIIQGNNMLTELPSLEGLSSLTELKVESNRGLWKRRSISIQGLTSLRTLWICAIPIGLQASMLLEDVQIMALQRTECYGLERMPNLTQLVIYGFPENFFPWPHNNEDDQLYFSSLKTLRVSEGDSIMSKHSTSLPEQLKYIPFLTSLEISKFHEMKALPEWLGNIKSLSSLRLWYNVNLKYMPSAEAMQRLTNLHVLEIDACPLLEARCTRGSGPEWNKISHIPNIRVSFEEIKSQNYKFC